MLIVFTKLPPNVSAFKEGSTANLTYEMKAPSDAIIYWTLTREHAKECIVPGMHSSTLDFNSSSFPTCTTTAVVDKTKDLIDEKFSLFRLELKVRKQIMYSRSYGVGS